MLYALTITMKPFTGHDQAVEGLILAGFVAYVLTFLMIVAGYHGFMDGSCFAAYVTITAAFAAGKWTLQEQRYFARLHGTI